MLKKLNITNCINACLYALADVAQWTECQPANGKVASSMPRPGTCPGCRPGPGVGAGGG